MAAGIQLPGDNETIDLQQQVFRLQALLEASRQVHSTISEDEVLDSVLRIVVRELEMAVAAFSGTGFAYGDPIEAIPLNPAPAGAPANQSHPRYALSVGSWEASKNLPREVYAAESDFLSTAELRVGSNGAKVLNLWTIDLEQDINTRFCFAPDGHLRFLDAANYTFNSESSEIVSWVYKQRRTFDSDGRVKSKSGHFEDGQGQKVSPPPMDADEEKSFDWVPSGRTLQELGLPAAWER